MKTFIAIAFSLSVYVEVAHAELWPSLDDYVARCTLIVLCETEFQDDSPVFKVVETWKGDFDLKHFNEFLQTRASGPGYLPAGLGLHSGRQSHLKQNVVFFFTGDPTKRPYDGSSTSFDVRGGKLIYGETGNPGVPKEYTLKQFKREVKKFVAAQAIKPATITIENATEQSDARETSAQSVLKSKSTPRSP